MSRILLTALLALSGLAWADGGALAIDCAAQACTCSASGQCPRHRPGHSPAERKAKAAQTFDATKVTTIRGTVLDVQKVDHGGVSQGVLLTVMSAGEQVTVHLGPAAFVEPKMTFAANDAVEIEGSRLDTGGATALVATTVKKGGKALVLRKADGTPLFRRGLARQ